MSARAYDSTTCACCSTVTTCWDVGPGGAGGSFFACGACLDDVRVDNAHDEETLERVDAAIADMHARAEERAARNQRHRRRSR